MRNEERIEIYGRIGGCLEDAKRQMRDKQQLQSILHQEQSQLLLIHAAITKEMDSIARKNAQLENEISISRS